jgi:hypothetical protein
MYIAEVTLSVPDHKRLSNNPLAQVPSCGKFVRSEVLTAVTIKNAVFWDVTPYDSCKNRRFGVAYSIHHQGGKVS